MTGREYRAVKCKTCIWQDFYEIGRRPSYPPRCPECGSDCEHEFFMASFPASARAKLGRDRGTNFVFGDPKQRYKTMSDRMHRRNWRGR